MDERDIEAQRAAVDAEAMTWLLTPYHDGARLKGVGVDCAQLVIASYVGAGLMDDVEPGYYPPDWHVHKTVERFMAFVPTWAVEISAEDAKPGDLMLCRFVRVFSHGVIIRSAQQGIHAWKKHGGVVLCDIDRDPDLLKAQKRYFTHRNWVA